MTEKTDDALVADILDGRRESFSILVRRHQQYAYGTAMGILSDFDLAQDVVQESFLLAHQELSKLHRPDRFGLWLRGIVRHTSFRALREIEKVRTLAAELARETIPFAPPPDRDDPEQMRRALVHQALEQLGEKNREVISLHYLARLSYAEIAAFLGVTQTAVQGRLQRARNKLKEEFKMVEERFAEEGLPEDFSAEIQRLLDASTQRRQEQDKAIERLAEIGRPAVDRLCAALEDGREQVRQVAAFALCAIGDTRALQPILRLLYSHRVSTFLAGEHWPAAWSQLRRVLSIPGARDALLRSVRSGNPQWIELKTLSHAIDDAEVYTCIEQLFRRTPDRRLTQWSLDALCNLRPEAAEALVAASLRSPDARLRQAAVVTALWRNITPPIDACLNAFDAPHGYHPIRVMHRHGEAGKQALKSLLASADANPVSRYTAAISLAQNGSGKALQEILSLNLLAYQKNPKRTWNLWRTMGWWHGPELAAWIERKGGNLQETEAIMCALANSDSDQVTIGPAIESLASEGSPSVRAAAIRTLARRRGATYLPELRRCLAAGQPRKVAQVAFHQLYKLRDDARPLAEEMLDSDSWQERKAAVCLLRRWGALTPEQRQKAKTDAHVAVRHAVAG